VGRKPNSNRRIGALVHGIISFIACRKTSHAQGHSTQLGVLCGDCPPLCAQCRRVCKRALAQVFLIEWGANDHSRSGIFSGLWHLHDLLQLRLQFWSHGMGASDISSFSMCRYSRCAGWGFAQGRSPRAKPNEKVWRYTADERGCGSGQAEMISQCSSYLLDSLDYYESNSVKSKASRTITLQTSFVLFCSLFPFPKSQAIYESAGTEYLFPCLAYIRFQKTPKESFQNCLCLSSREPHRFKARDPTVFHNSVYPRISRMTVVPRQGDGPILVQATRWDRCGEDVWDASPGILFFMVMGCC